MPDALMPKAAPPASGPRPLADILDGLVEAVGRQVAARVAERHGITLSNAPATADAPKRAAG